MLFHWNINLTWLQMIIFFSNPLWRIELNLYFAKCNKLNFVKNDHMTILFSLSLIPYT